MANKEPYGSVTYADPGYQSDGVKRYPLDSEEHVRAAWSYINVAKNAAKYTASQLSSIKKKIQSAMGRLGIKSEDNAAMGASASRGLTWVEEPYNDGGLVLVTVPQIPSPSEFGAGFITRSFPLEDIKVSPSDGRTVTAYAAVFDVEAEIQDHEGHYNEVIDRSAFNRAIERIRHGDSWRVGVFYNHAKTMYGTPSERGSMTIGRCTDIRPDSRGLLTETHYNTTSYADDILAMIKNGELGMSFTGPILRSDPVLSRSQRRQGGWRPDSTGNLRTVRRMELGLLEYGPTPVPAYTEAEIVGVRAHYLDSGEDQDVVPDESGEAVAVATDAFHRRLKAAMRARGL
jgi:HK97 family phage prohead protease